MYRVIRKFRDLRDNNHVYFVGDTFPREGVEPDAERIAELNSNKNKLCVPLIEEIAEKPKQPRKNARPQAKKNEV